MDNNRSTPAKKTNIYVQVILNYLIICLMMVCFSIVIVNAVNSAIPTWNGTYLVFLAFLIAAESLASSRLIKNSTILNSGPLVGRLTEWIVILIVVKILKYIFTNPAQLFTDINLWRQNFGSFFLHDDYLLVCIFLFFIWLLSSVFARCLDNLEEDFDLLDLERQGFARTNRPEALRGMMGLIFGMGFVMLFFTTISNINLPFVVLKSKSVNMNIALILLFFLMGFIILAQGQYSILRARWYIENIQVNRMVASRWISYSILLTVIIAFITLLASFLPTSYSLGIFDLVRSVLKGLFIVFTFLQLVCFAPLIAVFSLLARLFGQGSAPTAPGIQIPTPIPLPPTTPTASSSWIEVLKSILFWAIFLFVIFYAFRHYLSQRQGLLAGLRRFPLWGWAKSMFNWFTVQFLLVNRQITTIVNAGAARFRALIKTNPIRIDPLLTISSCLPPRQRILLVYLSMIHWNNRNGFPRKGNQTPFEYARSLNSSLPESKMDLDAITNAFIEARYTRHAMTHEQANQVQATLEHLQSVFREYLEHKQQVHDER